MSCILLFSRTCGAEESLANRRAPQLGENEQADEEEEEEPEEEEDEERIST